LKNSISRKKKGERIRDLQEESCKQPDKES
jgi:hypothetical protein